MSPDQRGDHPHEPRDGSTEPSRDAVGGHHAPDGRDPQQRGDDARDGVHPDGVRDGDDALDGRDADGTDGGATPVGTARRGGRRRRKKKAGPVKIFLLTLLTMFVVIALVVAGFAFYLNHKLDANVRRQGGMLPDAAAQTDRAPEAKDAKNILLLGSDSRTEDLRGGSRSDVIQLLHVDDDRRSVQVIHFPRDLYVDIPGKGKNKINAAYAYGGAPLLVRTLEKLTGTRIDHVAQIGFYGFRDLTNTLGGVDVNVDQPTTSAGHTFTKGVNHMNGDQALAFVRERKNLARGDIDRGQRQQAWIRAVMGEALSRGALTNPVKLSSMLDDVTKNLVVDDGFSSGEMRSLGLSMRNIRSRDITFLTAPYAGFDSVPGAGSVILLNETRMKTLGQALRTDRMSTVPGQISNPG